MLQAIIRGSWVHASCFHWFRQENHFTFRIYMDIHSIYLRNQISNLTKNRNTNNEQMNNIIWDYSQLVAISEAPTTHQTSTIDWEKLNKVVKKRKPWEENACRDTEALIRQRKQISDIEISDLNAQDKPNVPKKKRNWLAWRLISPNQFHKSKITAMQY